MRAILPLRSRPALWLLIPALIGVGGYARAYVDLSAVQGYWTAVGAGSAIFLLFSCALAATSAAIEGSRDRRGHIARFPAVRTDFAILANRLWPSVVAACVVQFVGFLVMSTGTWGSPGSVPVVVWASIFAVILFHTCLGYLIGRLLPLAAGIPVALVASYSWLGFTWSVSYFPLRYLSGLVTVDCCSVDTSLEPRGLVATIFFSVIAGALLLVIARSRMSMLNARTLLSPAIAILGVAVVLVGGLSIASGLGSEPVVARSQDVTRCEGVHPRICLYPEQVGAKDPSATLRKAAANLTAIGVSVPPTIRFTSDSSTPRTINMAARPVMTNQQIIYSFTSAFLPPTVAVYCGTEFDYNTRLDISAVIQTWLLVNASRGIASADDLPGASAAAVKEYRSLEELSPAAQLQWYKANMPALRDCKVKPDPLPSA